MNLEKLSARDAYVITPADSSLYRDVIGLYIGGAGNVKVITAGGSTVLFSAVPAGTILPVQCRTVYATDTTATLIVGLLP